jgi:hypothetical protein
MESIPWRLIIILVLDWIICIYVNEKYGSMLYDDIANSNTQAWLQAWP